MKSRDNPRPEDLFQFDPSVFRGEAGFRFAGLAALICCYGPTSLNHGALRTEIDAGSSLSSRLWALIETAEFREVVEESGKLGWVSHPIVAVRHLRNSLSSYLQGKEATALLKSTSTIAGVGATAHPTLKIAQASADVLANFTDSKETYRPPFFPLGLCLGLGARPRKDFSGPCDECLLSM
jgi:hypothetical protein